MDESHFEIFSSLMNHAAKSIHRIKAAHMRKYQLSAAHTTCLCRLAEAGDSGLTQVQLSTLDGMDRAHVSRILRELRLRGYVTVLEQSRRYKHRYALTPAGQEVFQDIHAVIRDVSQFVRGQIPDEELQVFYRTLYAIVQNLERATETYCSATQTTTRT